MRRRIERGLTLVELMISLVLALVVILAAATALRVARRGFATVDAMGQLQDNARFAVELIQRVASQSGYLDDGYAVQTRPRDFPQVAHREDLQSHQTQDADRHDDDRDQDLDQRRPGVRPRSALMCLLSHAHSQLVLPPPWMATCAGNSGGAWRSAHAARRGSNAARQVRAPRARRARKISRIRKSGLHRARTRGQARRHRPTAGLRCP
jgi:prepilin-type N-terminal cleavage/methylation domain-containing protein